MTSSAADDGGATDEETDWGWIFGTLMCNGAMRKREILESPLPALYAISEEVTKRSAAYAGIPLSDSSKSTEHGEQNEAAKISDEAFMAMINGGF